MNILLILILIASSLTRASDLVCSKREEVLWNKIQDSRNQGKMSLRQTLNAVVTSSNANLIVFGEVHGTPAEKEIYPEIFQEMISANGFDCMFIEWESMELYKKYNSWQMKQILKIAGTRKFQILPVDVANPSDNDTRNKAMANEINRHFFEGSCTKGFIIIGKAHLQATLRAGTTFQSYLNPVLVSEKLVNIVSDSPSLWDDNYLEDIIWKKCKDSISMIPIGVTSFLIDHELSDLPVYSDSSRLLKGFKNDKWTLFDALIIYR